MPALLLVDDEKHILNALQRELRDSDWDITACNDPEGGLQLLASQDFDVVMSDYRMPRVSGVQVLAEARRLQPTSMRIMLSGYTDAPAMLQAVNNAELFRYLLKPWDPRELQDALFAALRKRKEIKVGRMLIAQKIRERNELKRREQARCQLEAMEPGLTDVDFSPNGTIRIDLQR